MQSNTFSGLFEGQNVITLPQVDSTNEFLKQELSKSTPLDEGTVIMAEEQFAGKGQQGSTWYSEPSKNLTFSLLLKPSFLLPKHQFRLTMSISVAVAQWLESVLPVPVKIKWPNDLFVENKKIGGILIENVLKGATWKYAIVGVGINVNQTDFPHMIKERSTSIKLMLHKDSELRTSLAGLCRHIGQTYSMLKSGQFSALLSNYLRRLYRLGETHSFLVDGVPVQGVLRGVTEHGRLQIDFNGHLADFGLKEVSFVI